MPLIILLNGKTIRQKRKDRAKIIDDDVMGKNLEQWLTVKKKFHLSDAQVQMARELNLNPKKFGSLDNHGQESWKAPLPQFIEKIYFKRFKREAPLEVISIEQKMKNDKNKAEQQKKKRKAELKAKTGQHKTNGRPLNNADDVSNF